MPNKTPRSLLSRIKLKVLQIVSAFTQMRCRLKGVRFGKGCFIIGMPRLQLTRGSTVQLGEDVTLLSTSRLNPLIEQRISIFTLLPDAMVNIASHAGISGSRIVCCTSVCIGEYTILGPESIIYDSKGHDYSPQEGWRGRQGRHGKPVIIGAKCLIGMRCIILKGVTIGDHCIISAGTVVDRDVPAGHLAYGNPMQIVPLSDKYTR